MCTWYPLLAMWVWSLLLLSSGSCGCGRCCCCCCCHLGYMLHVGVVVVVGGWGCQWLSGLSINQSSVCALWSLLLSSGLYGCCCGGCCGGRCCHHEIKKKQQTEMKMKVLLLLMLLVVGVFVRVVCGKGVHATCKSKSPKTSPRKKGGAPDDRRGRERVCGGGICRRHIPLLHLLLHRLALALALATLWPRPRL